MPAIALGDVEVLSSLLGLQLSVQGALSPCLGPAEPAVIIRVVTKCAGHGVGKLHLHYTDQMRAACRAAFTWETET